MELKLYSVENTKSGHVFGVYRAFCEEGAICDMMEEAGEDIDTLDPAIKAFEVESE
jgi:hypothetical protein